MFRQESVSCSDKSQFHVPARVSSAAGTCGTAPVPTTVSVRRILVYLVMYDSCGTASVPSLLLSHHSRCNKEENNDDDDDDDVPKRVSFIGKLPAFSVV